MPIKKKLLIIIIIVIIIIIIIDVRMRSIICLWKCWDFQNKAKLRQIIVVVTMRSISSFFYSGWKYSNDFKTLKNNYMINPIDKIDMKSTASTVNGLISSSWIQLQIYISNSIVKNKGGSELKSTTK